MNGYQHANARSLVVALALLLAASLLTGCLGGSSSSGSSNNGQDETTDNNGQDETTDSNELLELQLSALSDVRQAHLSWSGTDTVDIYYSSDPDCDWDSYSTCTGSGLITNVGGGAYTIVASDHGLDSDASYYFVAEHNGQRSDAVAARAGAPEFDGTVTVSLAEDDRLYLGGSFRILGIGTGGYASFRSSDGLPQGALPRVDGRVYSILPAEDGGWYIAGYFYSVGGHERHSLARFRPDGALDTDWAPVVMEDLSDPDPGEVFSMALSEGRLIVAGEFRAVGSSTSELVERRYLAAFHAETGELDEDWLGTVDRDVYALAVAGNRVYVGGRFTEAGSPGDLQQRDYLAVFDGASGELVPDWSGVTNDRVRALAVVDDRLFVGGQFSAAGQPESMLDRLGLAAFDLENGELDTGWTQGVDDRVLAISSAGDRLYVGGSFDSAGAPGSMVNQAFLAAFDLTTGEIDAQWSPALDDRVKTLLATDAGLVAGGRFQTVDGTEQRYIARFSSGSGVLDSAWKPAVGARVKGLGEFRGKVHAGGRFDIAGINRIGHGRLAALSTDTGVPIDDWEAAVDDTVNVMLLKQGRLYVGGSFTQANGETRNHIAVFNPETGSLDPSWRGADSWESSVQDMAYADNRLFAVGTFESIDGTLVNGVAAFDAVTGVLQPQWDGGVSISDEPGSAAGANAITIEGDTLVVAGTLGWAGNGELVSLYTPRQRIAAFRLDSGQFLADWDGGVNNTVLNLVSHDGKIFASGLARLAGNGNDTNDYESMNRIAVFDAATGAFQSAWPGGVRHSFTSERVEAMGLVDDLLFVSGTFDRALSGSEEVEVPYHAVFDATSGAIDTSLPLPAFTVRRYPKTVTLHDDRVFYGGRLTDASVILNGEETEVSRLGFIAVDALSGELIW